MKSSVRLLKLFGISVEVHVSFILLLFFVLLSFPLYGVAGVFFFATIFTFVVLHELAHSLVAKSAGSSIDSIVLMFFGGVANVEVPENPRLELLMASAGPALNVAAAGVSLVLIHYLSLPSLGYLDVISPERFSFNATYVLHTVFYANVLLALFNVVPGFPMDGGRILRSLLALRMDYIRATELSVSAGQHFIFPLLFVWGLLEGNVVLVVISAALFIASGSELKLVKLKRAFLGLTAGDIARKPVPKVAGSVTLRDFIAGVADGSTTHYIVHGEDERVLGVLDLRELGGAGRRELSKTVADYAQGEYATVDAGKKASDSIKEFLSNDFLLVVSGSSVIGYVTPNHIIDEYNVMSIKKVLR